MHPALPLMVAVTVGALVGAGRALWLRHTTGRRTADGGWVAPDDDLVVAVQDTLAALDDVMVTHPQVIYAASNLRRVLARAS